MYSLIIELINQRMQWYCGMHIELHSFLFILLIITTHICKYSNVCEYMYVCACKSISVSASLSVLRCVVVS